jgi:hypothetical protein
MVQLRSCYFCGAVGDSLREYELVPDGVASTDPSHSAVLCSTCREKLRRAFEPMVEAAASSGQSTPGPADTVAASTQEVTFDADADDVAAPTPPVDTDDGEADADEKQGPTADEKQGPTADDGSSEVPEAYYKVLRLLQNREFPMERTDVTALVTGAYDVSPHECERILDTAVERGVLVEEGSTLTLGRD